MKVNGEGGSGAAAEVAVAVAVKSAEGRGSQRAVRWALENLMMKADRFVLIHVMPTITSIPTPTGDSIPIEEVDPNVVELYVQDMRAKCEEMFIPFKMLAKTREIETLILEGDNPALPLLKYIYQSGMRSVVMGSSSSNIFARKLKGSEVPSVVLKHGPETCDIYVVSPQKLITNSLNPLLTAESSSRQLLITQQSSLSTLSSESEVPDNYGHSPPSDLSHPNLEAFDHDFAPAYTNAVEERNYQNLDHSISGFQTVEGCTSSPTYLGQPDTQAEAEWLRLELQRTIAMYSQVCEDLVHAQNKVHLLSSEYLEEAQKVNAAQKREESLRRLAAEEKVKHMEAEKEVELARKTLAKEGYERQIAELNALRESLEKQKIVDELILSDGRYRKYTRDEIEVATDFFSETKVIGEGAYGKIYKCSLDHTPVAVKVLHPDASDKKEEFLREVEVLSQLRHPHIVLLLGACPENGCLVYEYMENGNLHDHIFRRSSRRPLPWFLRFRIVFEVACGLAYLHNSKPEPIVHRDLKPGNILLDKNYVTKIGDVGLAKIISEVVPDNVTEYKNSILAGTLHYMDPEYQRTGTLRPKSDLYAFGIIILQLLAARSPIGLILKIENAINQNCLSDILDKSVPDWPLAEAEELAQMALRCCKMRCRERPDLESEVMPVLKRLAEFADASIKVGRNHLQAPSHFYCPILQEIMDDPQIAADGFTYEHMAIKAWLGRHNLSPVTKLRLQHKMLTPNHTLRSAIQQWRTCATSSRT